MPPRLQIGTQLAVVVDGAVEHQAQFRVDHRLVRTARQVNDRQSPMSQRNAARLPDAGIVRSTPLQRRQHTFDQPGGDRCPVEA